jgi:multidrug resistance efflux pump
LEREFWIVREELDALRAANGALQEEVKREQGRCSSVIDGWARTKARADASEAEVARLRQELEQARAALASCESMLRDAQPDGR